MQAVFPKLYQSLGLLAKMLASMIVHVRNKKGQGEPAEHQGEITSLNFLSVSSRLEETLGNGRAAENWGAWPCCAPADSGRAPWSSSVCFPKEMPSAPSNCFLVHSGVTRSLGNCDEGTLKLKMLRVCI